MKKKLEDNEVRIIKINRDAVYEFLYETIIENSPAFFDLHDMTKAEFQFSWDADGTLSCIAYKRKPGRRVDISAIEEATEFTTNSLFTKKRYKTILLTD